jgi:hypothetical protein
MASTTKNIGTKGRMRVSVDLVSQDLVNNTSIVRVKGDVWVTSKTYTDNSGKCKARFTGTNSTDDKVINGSYTSKARLILDETFTINHDSDGDKTVSYTFTFGPTTTTSLGKVVSSVSTSLVLPTIPVNPGYPLGVTAVLTLPHGITVNYTLPITNSPILEYQIGYSKNSDMSNSTVISNGTVLTKTFSDLDQASTYYFQIRARNVAGFGVWSATIGKPIPGVPGKMVTPDATFAPPATITITLTPPSSDGGSTVLGYDVQYSSDADFLQVVTISVDKGPVVINNLSPSVEYYRFRVRARNIVGAGDWSDSRIETIIGGPRVNVQNTHTNTIEIKSTLAFVKHTDNIYHPAIPYVNDAGVWRIAGG